MKIKKVFISFIAILSIVGFIPQQAFADPLGNVTTYNLSQNMWRRPVQIGSKVWSMNDDDFISYDLTTQQTNTYAGPSNEISHLVKGPDSNLWYAYYHASGNGRIGKVLPNGSITEYTIPQERTGDVQPALTLTAGPDGRMWLNRSTYEENGQYRQSILILNLDGTLYRTIKYGSSFSGSPDKSVIKLITDYSENAVWELSYNEVYDQQLGRAITTLYVTKMNQSGNRITYELPYKMSRVFRDISTDSAGNLWLLAGSDDHTTTYISKISHDLNGWNTSISQLPSTTARGTGGTLVISDGYLWVTHATYSSYLQLSRVDPAGITGNASEIQSQYIDTILNNNSVWEISPTNDGNLWMNDGQPKLHKIGTGSSGGSDFIDEDSDGLSLTRETSQNTSDTNPDTDGDGLRDFLESQWSPLRNDLFCNSLHTTCEYPDPATKDIYVEVDWMTRPAQGSNSAYETKPTNAEIQEIKDAFAAKSINAHFDIGQLSGGNEVPYQQELSFLPDENSPDFQDYKNGGDGINAQFDSSRYHIYHYLISGYGYTSGTSSGIAGVGDDDLFISYGSIKELNNIPGTLSQAISGTMIHELGHNLCLSKNDKVYYDGQPAACRFNGIDTSAGANYESALNYDKQYLLTDYSSGLNSAQDHDDWAAIRIQDFTNSNFGDAEGSKLHLLQKQFKNNRNALKKSPEYKKLLKDIDKLIRRLSNHKNH